MASYSATRLAVLLLVIQLATLAAGSCLSYGHSCWGAHGKRSFDNGADKGVGEREVTVPDESKQWRLHDLRTLQQLDNESSSDLTPSLSLEEQDYEDVQDDLVIIADEDAGIPRRPAPYRILHRPERKLDKSEIIAMSP